MICIGIGKPGLIQPELGFLQSRPSRWRAREPGFIEEDFFKKILRYQRPIVRMAGESWDDLAGRISDQLDGHNLVWQLNARASASGNSNYVRFCTGFGENSIVAWSWVDLKILLPLTRTLAKVLNWLSK